MAKDIQIAVSVDVDAVAAWIGTFGGADSPHDISRGMFAGEVAIPRLVKLFDRFGAKTTWFAPGHSIETFPEQMKMVAEAGHEIGLHGYTHENALAMTPEQEAEIFDRTIDIITGLTGRRPVGFSAPWCEHSEATIGLLLERGVKYDRSLCHDDFSCYRVRIGDSWTVIDYAEPASTWMKPLVRGRETPLIEVPFSWHLDDLPPMMFIRKSPNSHGFVNPRDIEELWRDQFDWMYREMDEAVYSLCLHPDVAGRPQVLLLLERLFSYFLQHPGVRFATLEAVAADYDRRHPFEG